ncbi:MAG: DUF5916 domain-containing protein, partial [bacterium]
MSPLACATLNVVALFVTGSTLLAQEEFRLQRLNGVIKLDGHSDEPAWQMIVPLPLTMRQPTFSGTPTERTEIRLAYDDDFLYASGRFYDSDPCGVRVNSLYRDRNEGDDTFDLIVDTFNDNENALWFWTNPAGVRGDLAISNDGSASNESWNTLWEVARAQTAEGWFAEMRLPFSSLGFQNRNGRVVVGLIALRYIARKNERLMFPAISPNRDFESPSQAQDVILEQVRSPNPLYITPHIVGGYSQTAQPDHAGTAYHLNDKSEQDFGLDAKYNLTGNLTLDLTVNTDFAQAEADNQEINLTRFSLFFPEKRQFFQERASIFEFNTGENSRLFHSRQIGLHDGKAVSIPGGARLVGRLQNWDVGFINMQTARSEALPSENFGVLRLRRQVFNEVSYAGGMLTSRLGADGSRNLAYGLDGSVHVFGNEYLTMRGAQTFDDARHFDFWRAALLHVQWQRRKPLGFDYNLYFTRMGADYFPALGFVARQNFTGASGYFRYGWWPGEGRTLRRISPVLVWNVFARNHDGSVESAYLRPYLHLEWKSGGILFGGIDIWHEDLIAPLALPEQAA